MRIAFCWTNGVRNQDVFNHWDDGLRQALRLMEAEGHVITYHEPDEDLPTVDWILYWESPITHDSEYGPAYKKVKNSPQKKALLFSGGPIKKEWVDGFDHIFVESKINADEFDALGIRNSTAFGVNTDVFRPTMEHKAYKTVTHGTCASWKRQWLVCEALGDQALVFGRPQEADPRPFDECRKCGSTVLLGQSYQETARLINSAQVGVNCADFWGGGQRATLEAMACGLPVVVMEDSPKNREYVEDGGLGFICPPQADAIRATVDEALALSTDQKLRAREYVMSKWTAEHYKDNLLNAL